MREYWKHFYRNQSFIQTGNMQKNVGRTLGGEPISEDSWKVAISYIKNLLGLQATHTLIELCCGNGMVIGPLSRFVKRALGVDFSPELLAQLKNTFSDTVETICADALEISLEPSMADAIIIYFSIQHFGEKDTVVLLEKCVKTLKPGGRLLIGDVPDQTRKWEYIGTPEYRKDYIQRVLDNCPKIGTWFHPEFFYAFECFSGDITVKICKQPHFLINSFYRYDVLITKTTVPS